MASILSPITQSQEYVNTYHSVRKNLHSILTGSNPSDSVFCNLFGKKKIRDFKIVVLGLDGAGKYLYSSTEFFYYM